VDIASNICLSPLWLTISHNVPTTTKVLISFHICIASSLVDVDAFFWFQQLILSFMSNSFMLDYCYLVVTVLPNFFIILDCYACLYHCLTYRIVHVQKFVVCTEGESFSVLYSAWFAFDFVLMSTDKVFVPTIAYYFSVTHIYVHFFEQKSTNLSMCIESANLLSAKHISSSFVKASSVWDNRTHHSTIISSTSCKGGTFW
jgi:hypothetical protein